MRKIDLVKFYHELMELGIAPDMASRVVTLCDVMQRDGRQKDIERSRRYREAHKAAGGQGGGSSLSLTPSISSSEVKENAKEVVSKKGRKRKPAIPLPDDFAPSDAHFAKAASLGCSPAFVLSKFEDMKIWAQSNDARKQDWGATLHGFIRRDAEKGRQREQFQQPSLNQVIRHIGKSLTTVQPGNGSPRPPFALGVIPNGQAE